MGIQISERVRILLYTCEGGFCKSTVSQFRRTPSPSRRTHNAQSSAKLGQPCGALWLYC